MPPQGRRTGAPLRIGTNRAPSPGGRTGAQLTNRARAVAARARTSSVVEVPNLVLRAVAVAFFVAIFDFVVLVDARANDVFDRLFLIDSAVSLMCSL